MSTSGAEPAVKRRSRTATPILDAAEQLFADKGFQRTTVDEIAEAADVAVGSVYFHFESKDGLYLALVERALHVNEEFMAEVDRTLGPLDRVMAAGDCYLRFALEHPSKFRLVVLRVLEPAVGGTLQETERRVAARVSKLVGRVAEDLREAVDVGQARAIDPEDAMRFLWGAWNGVIGLSLRQDDLKLSQSELERVLGVARDVVLRGLRP